MKRRTFLKGTLSVGAVTVAAGAGLLTPQVVLAAWPANAFHAKSVDGALTALFKTDQMTTNSHEVKLRAPDIAENGAVVPITVETSLANASSISIIVPNNPTALASKWDLGPTTEGFVSCRIKMGKTSKVITVVKAGDKLYSASKNVKVTIGGCGG